MAMMVRVPASSLMACWISFSVSTSTEAVASSGMMIGDLRRIALAMAIRCFCPRIDAYPVLQPSFHIDPAFP